MVTGEEILRFAAREIGYHEGKNKHNKYGEWYGVDGVAWCMAFVQWIYHQANADLPIRTASCGALLRWYQKNQPECITQKPIEGCIVIFDFPKTNATTDHTGLFVKRGNRKITTIDGNTTAGNESNGGWVQQRTRPIDYANPIYIVPRGLIEVDIDRLISEMTDEQAYKLYCKAEKHMGKLPLPTSWSAKGELNEAVKAGITDGSRPMVPARRYEAAIMDKRAVKNESN